MTLDLAILNVWTIELRYSYLRVYLLSTFLPWYSTLQWQFSGNCFDFPSKPSPEYSNTLEVENDK